MIEQLRIHNFHGFKSKTTLQFAPLTLIFGPNSSGKTSIIKSLLLLKQSMSSDFAESARMTFTGQDVDLGTFTTAINGHDTSKTMTLGITFSSGNGIDFQVADGGRISKVDLQIVTNENRVNSSEEITKVGLGFIRSESNDFQLKTYLQRDLRLFSKIPRAFATNLKTFGNKTVRTDKSSQALETALMNSKYGFKSFPGTVFGIQELANVQELENPELRIASISQKKTANDIRSTDQFVRYVYPINLVLSRPSRELQLTCDGISHLAGLRSVPSRFSAVGPLAGKIAADASNLTTVLNSDLALVRRVSAWLKKLTGNTYELDVVDLTNKESPFLGEFGALVLRDKKSKVITNFQDAGVGLSQVLPIIAALIKSRKPKHQPSQLLEYAPNMLLLEQPELHLHPKMQGDLAELLIDNSLIKDPSGPQIVVETHSENLILRVQRKIRDGSIRPEQVSVLYVSKNSKTGATEVKHLPLEENGDFQASWPEDFSDLRMQELL